jgi:hypothetical protein
MYSSDKLQEQSISLEAIRPTDRPTNPADGMLPTGAEGDGSRYKCTPSDDVPHRLYGDHPEEDDEQKHDAREER